MHVVVVVVVNTYFCAYIHCPGHTPKLFGLTV